MHRLTKIGLIFILFFIGEGGLWLIKGCLNLAMQLGEDANFHIGLWTLEIVLALFTVLLIYYAIKD